MQNTSNETARAILGNTRTKITLFIKEEYPPMHEATIGKTRESMSATTNPAAEYYANVARNAATAILDGVMAAALHDAQVLATIEKAIPEGAEREAYTRWLNQYRCYDPEAACHSRVSQRHIANNLSALAKLEKDVTFTPRTHQ